MMNLISTGLFYYIETEEGCTRIDYATYLALCEANSKNLPTANVKELIDHHRKQLEPVVCPLCDKGLIQRRIVEDPFLLDLLHDGLSHTSTSGACIG